MFLHLSPPQDLRVVDTEVFAKAINFTATGCALLYDVGRLGITLMFLQYCQGGMPMLAHVEASGQGLFPSSAWRLESQTQNGLG